MIYATYNKCKLIDEVVYARCKARIQKELKHEKCERI